MAIVLKLTTIGTFTGAIILEEMLNRMKVTKGDSLYAIEATYGYLITPDEPSIDAQFESGRQFMKDYRDTFKTLAK